MWSKYHTLVVGTAFLSAVSQILLNYSNKKEYKKKIYEYLNPYVISSYAILFIVLVLNIFAMRFLELKIAHAIAASTYVFVLILGRIFLYEKITKNRFVGIILITAGIIIFIL